MLLAATLLHGCTCWDLRSHGLSGECPDSELRLALDVSAGELRRGAQLLGPDAPPTAPERAPGWLTVRTEMQWLSGDGAAAAHHASPYSGPAEIAVSLVDRDDNELAVAVGAFTVEDGRRNAPIALPEVPDGDYRLRIAVDTALDGETADVPLALYAPALVHVMSDRPLVRPGETVHLRSLVLRRADLAPLGDRPGRWQVLAPDGVEVLAESDTAGPWGVADTSLPLHPEAPPGVYRAIYTSGADRDEVSFEVRPFVLPRVTAEVAPARAWFAVGDALAVQGVARYGSGAPVADARVTVTLRTASGSWPPPTAWEAPQEVRTAADGTFRAAWGAVPRDLHELTTLTVEATVREEGGETVVASTAAVLSPRTLWVEAVTELDDGLVGGVNNRAYLRVTTPDGAPLAGARITVANPWDPRMAPKASEADEDGVVAIQIDPGDPVTLVDPAPPVRQPAGAVDVDVAAPHLVRGVELGTKRELALDEREALDAAPALLMPCRDAQPGALQRTVVLQVAASGGVVGTVPGAADATSACLAARLRGLRLPAGAERTLVLTYDLPDSERPFLSWTASDVVGSDTVGDAVTTAVERAGDAARTCLSPGRGSGEAAVAVHWRARAEREDVEVRVGPAEGAALPAGVTSCLVRALSRIRLDEAPEDEALGVLVAHLQGGVGPVEAAPASVAQATTRTGYELQVTATAADGRPLGEGRVRFDEGRIPPLRIRVTPSIVAPGDRVTVELLRGPDATIELPEALTLTSETGAALAEAELDGNTAAFTVPAEARGFLAVRHAGVTAHAWVQRPDRLVVSLASDRPVYRPGETARLTVQTLAGAAPTQAAVGLSGVDAALGRIAALPGPDDYGRVTVRATSASAPFGVFDARALLLGRIRGRNAAQAAVQRVVPPSPAATAAGAVAAGTGSGRPDAAGALAAAFGRAYPAALRRVRDWEAAAGDGDTFDNEAMARIWADTLAELREETPVVDVWGRELTLRRLPPELLAQLDPRQMLNDGTHLPEDLVAWATYVSRSE